MDNYYTILTAMTGDDSKPLLVAVCLIVSIVLMVILVITGLAGKRSESSGEEDMNEDDDSNGE